MSIRSISCRWCSREVSNTKCKPAEGALDLWGRIHKLCEAEVPIGQRRAVPEA